MNAYFRCIALDFDGTLTEGGRPSPDVLNAIAELRQSGRKVLLVTGRMLPSLKSVFPDAEQHFDRSVVENGAVILNGDDVRILSAPVPLELDDALRGRGVPVERGQVILASKVEYDAQVMDEIRRL
ncbi:MAG TPA: HAD hydrolase family protein, partial [Vicinamibacteria bacterium]|nr:HAD hydrolase family protein [Vicinamibacteria bacterium]